MEHMIGRQGMSGACNGWVGHLPSQEYKVCFAPVPEYILGIDTLLDLTLQREISD